MILMHDYNTSNDNDSNNVDDDNKCYEVYYDHFHYAIKNSI